MACATDMMDPEIRPIPEVMPRPEVAVAMRGRRRSSAQSRQTAVMLVTMELIPTLMVVAGRTVAVFAMFVVSLWENRTGPGVHFTRHRWP